MVKTPIALWVFFFLFGIYSKILMSTFKTRPNLSNLQFRQIEGSKLELEGINIIKEKGKLILDGESIIEVDESGNHTHVRTDENGLVYKHLVKLVEVFENNESIQQKLIEGDNVFTKFNFHGDGVFLEQDNEDPRKVNIFIPCCFPEDFQPEYNTGDALVNNIPTINRYLAEPTTEGDPYKINPFTPGELGPCIRTVSGNIYPVPNGLIVYTHTEKCSFEDENSLVHAIIYDADGETILAEHITTEINGNLDVNENNIRIEITGWEEDGSRYQGIITVTYDIKEILSNGGVFSIKIKHINTTFTSEKNQGPVFYDTNPNYQSVGLIDFDEGVNVITRHISGVEYYDLYSEFEVDIYDLNYLNSDSYPQPFINVDGIRDVPIFPEFCLEPLTPLSSELNGWDIKHNNINSTYNKNDWKIIHTSYFMMSLNPTVRILLTDWITTTNNRDTNYPVLIETRDFLSTDTIEKFLYENYRCPLDGNFDMPNQKGWISQNFLNSDDACFFNMGCGRIIHNFTPYNPNPLLQPNYDSQNEKVYLIREFITDGIEYANAVINISGTYDSLEVKMAKPWDGTSTGGSVWMDALKPFSPGFFNNGNPMNNTGCKTSGEYHDNNIQITFQFLNIINTNNTIYLKIGFIGEQRITQLSVSFI